MGDKKPSRFKKAGTNKGQRISALDLSPDYVPYASPIFTSMDSRQHEILIFRTGSRGQSFIF